MEFIDNKYTKWYFTLVHSRCFRTLDEATYTESHHIIPKSLGGSNTPDNLVKLTAREHFIAHWLLTKMCSGQQKAKMCYAFFSMSFDNGNTNRNYSSRYHEMCKMYLAKANKLREPNKGYKWKDTSNLSKAKIGNKNMLGKRHSDSAKALMSLAHTGKVLSDSTKFKMSESKLGVTKSVETKVNMSKAQSAHAICPHCNKSGNYRAMLRWHFDRCKLLTLRGSHEKV